MPCLVLFCLLQHEARYAYVRRAVWYARFMRIPLA